MAHFSGRRLRALAWAVLPLVALVGGCHGNVPGRLGAQGSGDLSNPPATRSSDLAALTADCGPEDAAPGALERQPFVQLATDHAATLVWREAGDSEAEVVVTRADGSLVERVQAEREDSVRTPSGVAQQTARLEGLAPATRYCYAVEERGLRLAHAGFATAPAVGSAQPVRFVVFGDSGGGSADQIAVRDQLDTVPFDFMLHTGDIAYDHGTRGELAAHVFAIYAAQLERAPLFPASGNHDYETEDAAPFREAFHLPANGGPEGKERWYSFDWGDVHFVALDTERIGAAQAAWLDDDLARTPRRWVIVYGHRPPFSSGTHGGDDGYKQWFLPILERHHVPLVLSGHDHDYERTRTMGGVTYVVTGGGGEGTGDVHPSAFTAYAEPVQHFLYVTVDGDALALHAIDGLGREFDSLVLHR
jgi:hypothetical protein